MSDALEENQDISPQAEAASLGVKDGGEKIYTASQWQLTWWKFRKHKLAMVSLSIIILLYLVVIFCEFLAPYPLEYQNIPHQYAPPQQLHFFSEDGFQLRPFVYGLKAERHKISLKNVVTDDTSQKLDIKFFVRGGKYKMWGLFETDIHLFGVGNSGGTLYLMGTDSLGRDMFSRILYGTRISLTIGLIGVTMTFVLGLTIGCISGYFGGWVDHLIQRFMEVLRSFPTFPLWMALSAALPQTWSPLKVYFGITIVLSLIAWTNLARVVRGKILSLREEDFSMAAKLCGASNGRIMFRHLLPSFTSHIIVSLSLMLPRMILGETALSFLGLGLKKPITSWGVLLKEAQNVQAVAQNPWLLLPAAFVILAVLSFNFVGDGLRDAADPYSR